MRKVIDLKKQSKKAPKAFYASQRGSWNGLNPITRVVPNGKAYSRAKAKAEARKDACRPFFCPFSPAAAPAVNPKFIWRCGHRIASQTNLGDTKLKGENLYIWQAIPLRSLGA